MRVKEFLRENGPKTSQEIEDYINERYKSGVLPHTLGNILGKDPDFVSVGKRQSHRSYHVYDVTVWAIRDSA